MRRAAVLSALALAGCAAEPPAPLRPEATMLEGPFWRLSELKGAPVETGVSLTFDEGRMEGTAPCNRYFGAYVRESGRTLGVGAVAATRRACPRLELERRYFGALVETASYQIEHGVLTLLDAADAPLMRFGT